jgi:hypothetical protein
MPSTSAPWILGTRHWISPERKDAKKMGLWRTTMYHSGSRKLQMNFGRRKTGYSDRPGAASQGYSPRFVRERYGELSFVNAKNDGRKCTHGLFVPVDSSTWGNASPVSWIADERISSMHA